MYTFSVIPHLCFRSVQVPLSPVLLRFKMQLGVFLSVTWDTEAAPTVCVLHLIKQMYKTSKEGLHQVTQQSFPSKNNDK